MSKLILVEETYVDEQGHVLVYECLGTESGMVCSVLQARLGDSAAVAPHGDNRVRVTVPDKARYDTVKDAIAGIDTYLGM